MRSVRSTGDERLTDGRFGLRGGAGVVARLRRTAALDLFFDVLEFGAELREPECAHRVLDAERAQHEHLVLHDTLVSARIVVYRLLQVFGLRVIRVSAMLLRYAIDTHCLLIVFNRLMDCAI